VNPTELSPHERTAIFHKLLNHLDASQRMVVTVADTRWHVAVTRFRQGWQDGGLTRAFSRYLTGLFLSKDDAITDLVEKANLFGREQDVLVSWATSAEALREELLVIQGCLNAAGVLDDRQPLDFGFGADFSAAHTVGAGVHYDNQTGKVELLGDVDPGKLLAGMLSAHLTGRLGFTLRRNRLKDDPRLPMMAGIIALELFTGVTCSVMITGAQMLADPHAGKEDVDWVSDMAAQGEQRLRAIFDVLKPQVQALGDIRKTPEGKHSGRLMDALFRHIFEDRAFDLAFLELKTLKDVVNGQNRDAPHARQTWTLLSAFVYLGGQVARLKALLKDRPDATAGYHPTLRR